MSISDAQRDVAFLHRHDQNTRGFDAEKQTPPTFSHALTKPKVVFLLVLLAENEEKAYSGDISLVKLRIEEDLDAKWRYSVQHDSQLTRVAKTESRLSDECASAAYKDPRGRIVMIVIHNLCGGR
eukprot:GHVO01058798.1.p1 GENE.GHVO01058798.1~~GHVO01058798.1.p1  ORF type:complete len:125 (-),score=5.89 GHVO01058798.1:59-433(-)